MDAESKARRVPSGTSGPHKSGGGVAAFRLLEHTADMGIEAQAPTCEELFVQAGKALLAVLAGKGEIASEGRELTFEVMAGDVEELLVVWLNELLYLVQTKRLWPREIAVTALQPGALQGRLRVVPQAGDPGREIKAVTYHHLLVTRRHGHWRARVYLDL
jgi:SHS2 domain-containing protein